MRRGSWRDELLRAESGVLLQPTAHRVPHPTDMQAPSKINFPAVCFLVGLSWEKVFMTPLLVLIVQKRESTRGAKGKLKMFDVQQQSGEKQIRIFVESELENRLFHSARHWCARADHRDTLAAEGGEMPHWSSHCWLVHLQHGVSGRW